MNISASLAYASRGLREVVSILENIATTLDTAAAQIRTLESLSGSSTDPLASADTDDINTRNIRHWADEQEAAHDDLEQQRRTGGADSPDHARWR